MTTFHVICTIYRVFVNTYFVVTSILHFYDTTNDLRSSEFVTSLLKTAYICACSRGVRMRVRGSDNMTMLSTVLICRCNIAAQGTYDVDKYNVEIRYAETTRETCGAEEIGGNWWYQGRYITDSVHLGYTGWQK